MHEAVIASFFEEFCFAQLFLFAFINTGQLFPSVTKSKAPFFVFNPSLCAVAQVGSHLHHLLPPAWQAGWGRACAKTHRFLQINYIHVWIEDLKWKYCNSAFLFFFFLSFDSGRDHQNLHSKAVGRAVSPSCWCCSGLSKSEWWWVRVVSNPLLPLQMNPARRICFLIELAIWWIKAKLPGKTWAFRLKFLKTASV